MTQGLVSNTLNPKIAVFFTSLLPQFVGAHGSAGDLLLLGLLFNAMGVGWLICYATAVARGRNVLVRPRVRRTLDQISGLVLIGLGKTPRARKALVRWRDDRTDTALGRAVKWWFPGRYFGLHHKNRALEEWKRTHGPGALAEWKRRPQEE